MTISKRDKAIIKKNLVKLANQHKKLNTRYQTGEGFIGDAVKGVRNLALEGVNALAKIFGL